MGVKHLAILGFGYSASTALADALLECKEFQSYPDYEEIDELRAPGGLVDQLLLYQKAKGKKILFLKLMLNGIVRLVRRFIWGFRVNLFIKNSLSFRSKISNNFKRLQCDMHYISCILWIKNRSQVADVHCLISFYLNGLRDSCKVDTGHTLILNQITFPEFLVSELLMSLPSDVKITVTTRNVFDSLYEMERYGDYFESQDLAQDFILGRDEQYILRRKNYLNVLRYRIESMTKSAALFSDDIFIVSFDSMIKDFDKLFSEVLTFSGFSHDQVSCNRSTKNERHFDPERSAKNIRPYGVTEDFLKSLGYTESMFDEIKALNVLLVNLETSNRAHHKRLRIS